MISELIAGAAQNGVAELFVLWPLRILLGVVLLIVVAVVAIVMRLQIPDPNRKPIFRGVVWGDSVSVVLKAMRESDVLKVFPDTPTAPDTLQYDSTIKSEPCTIFYSFFKDQLWRISVHRNGLFGQLNAERWLLVKEQEFTLWKSILYTLEGKYGKGERNNQPEYKEVTFEFNDYTILHRFNSFESKESGSVAANPVNGYSLTYRWKSPISEMASAAQEERFNKKLEKSAEKKKNEL